MDALRQLAPPQLDHLLGSLQWVVQLIRQTGEGAAGKTLLGE